MNTKATVGILLFVCMILALILFNQGPSASSTLQNVRVFPSYQNSFFKNESVSEVSEAFLDGSTEIQANYLLHLENLIKVAASHRNSTFYQDHVQRQRNRHAHLASVCSSRGNVNPPNPGGRGSEIPDHMWVIEKYKVVYCSIPKVASSSWKSVMLVLNGVANTTDTFSQYIISRRSPTWMRKLSSYSFQERETILHTYTKFMFSRNPFSRVLSAFQNKLAPDSTFPRAKKWQRRFGERSLKLYRPNWKKGMKYDLKFSEFVKFICHSGSRLNIHWNVQYQHCRPCDYDYTILGHFETLQEDSELVLRVIGAFDSVQFPSANHSSPTNSSQSDTLLSFLETVSDADLAALYDVYEKDFQLFGYPAG